MNHNSPGLTTDQVGRDFQWLIYINYFYKIQIPLDGPAATNSNPKQVNQDRPRSALVGDPYAFVTLPFAANDASGRFPFALIDPRAFDE